MKSSPTDPVDIHGVVIPTQWDKRGNIIQVAIQTDSFEKYLIDDEYNTILLGKIDHKVRVHASIIGEDVLGQKIIEINWLDNSLFPLNEGIT